MKNFKSLKPILKKSRKGFVGYPLATIAFYGPTNKLATKVVLGIFQREDDEPLLFKWYSEKEDIRPSSTIKIAWPSFASGKLIFHNFLNQKSFLGMVCLITKQCNNLVQAHCLEFVYRLAH